MPEQSAETPGSKPPDDTSGHSTLQEATFRCAACDFVWVAFGSKVNERRCIFCGSESTTTVRR